MSNRSNTPNRTRIVLGIVVALIIGAMLIFAFASNNEAAEQSAQLEQPSPEPVCRAEGEFVAGFMSPQVDDTATHAMLERMNTDAVTFGGRIVPAMADDYPEEVTDVVGDRQIYEYTVMMNWRGLDPEGQDTTVEVGDTEYGIIQAGDDSVVITESVNGGDMFHSLARVSEQRNNNAYIGLPVPQMRTTGATWLPDNSYADVIDDFAEEYVDAYYQRGADGFYLAMEMPLTDASHWNPVTDYYSRQTQIINDTAPGTIAIVSPYLEGREDRGTITPDTAAAGYQKLLNLGNGTRIVVSPQDGRGAGTTALEADESEEHRFTAEDYFQALHEVDANRLYVTIEAMTPGGGSSDSREPTSRDRVEEQLDATDPYVQGAIGFQWTEPNSMIHIPHIGEGACAAGPGKVN